MEAIKRIGRYLLGRPRLVQYFMMQPRPKYITSRCDSDHAGCVITRRSTTGLALFHGRHLLRASSNTQTVVATSSGESEFYAIVRGTSFGLGAKSMAADLGMTVELEVETDASAGRGIALRLGAGKIRHLHTQYLRVQGTFNRREAKLNKIDGDKNQADLMTKHLEQQALLKHVKNCECEFVGGRSKLALEAAV
jgi:hypothetical protein